MFSFQGLCCGDPRPCGEDHVEVTKRNDAREREILTLSLLNHLWPSRSNWRHVRDRNTTLGCILVHVCDAGLMRMNTCGNVPMKWQTSPLSQNWDKSGGCAVCWYRCKLWISTDEVWVEARGAEGEMRVVFFPFLFQLHDSRGDSEGGKEGREHRVQMCGSVVSQFGFCGETTPVPPLTFLFDSLLCRCGLVSIVAWLVHVNQTHSLFQL